MQIPSINLYHLSYVHPDATAILEDLGLSFSQKKIGIVGKNGSGKTTLLKILADVLQPTSGSIQRDGSIFYCPQRIAANGRTVAALLGVEDKLEALARIAQGSVEVSDFTLVGDDWHCEANIKKLLGDFDLVHIDLSRHLSTLSGGECTRMLLAAAFFSDADFLMLDEPTNNLDANARQIFYEKIKAWKKGIIIASHDRELLQQVDEIVELSTIGCSIYGGNYSIYETQKAIEQSAAEHELDVAKREMKQAKQSIQTTRERHEQRQKRGRQTRRKQDQTKLFLNGKAERSEQTQSSMLVREKRLLKQGHDRLTKAREHIENSHAISIELPKTSVPRHKMILEVERMFFSYDGCDEPLLKHVNLQMKGPERIALKGPNGSGKTSLINLLLGKLQPTNGSIKLGVNRIFYVDQSISGLDENNSVLENFQQYNPEYDNTQARHCLAQFLFRGDDVNKMIGALSGGERLRALLACVFMSAHPPQLLILDEPTNHLDLQSVLSLESALACYQGAMLVVSHDEQFLDNIGVQASINLGLN